MKPVFQRWINISLLNLLIVASIGVILRYKILYPLAFIDQQQLLHGHSHFAFTGWITHTLMALFILSLSNQSPAFKPGKYRLLINANLFCAYGMLISFPLQGYGLWSIIFSTLSVFVSYAFAIIYWKDLDALSQKSSSHLCFRAALVFNVISSAGVFALAIMMATKNMQQHLYLAAVYGYLHFQYNGWFFFGILGLFLERFLPSIQNQHRIRMSCILFVASCVPAYLLSVLWFPLPAWEYIIVVIAAFTQIFAWINLLYAIKKNSISLKQENAKLIYNLLLLVATAFTIKLLLQLGSTIPSLSSLAFGFRPIVIGYLHLILLGVISLFLLTYLFGEKLIQLNKLSRQGIIIFTSGIIINEILLMTQGITSIEYNPVPYINECLLAAALILFTGILLMNYGNLKFKR